MTAETIIANARLVLEDEIVPGSLAFAGGAIRALDTGSAVPPGAIDAEGDFVAPGLIEMHTDHMERHFMPRPRVVWPDKLAAALAHDAQMAAAGVTTVYDAIAIGTEDVSGKEFRRHLHRDMVEAVRQGVAANLFRIDHRIHLRCELTSGTLMRQVEAIVDEPLVQLASLMDHTPGQRQFRRIADLKTLVLTNGESESAFDDEVRRRMEEGPALVRENRARIVPLLARRGLVLATHDDTTEAHVAEAVAIGARISEFPTTEEAARAAGRVGLATVAGAPNVVRGGSHSGGVSVTALVEAGLLDGLSSDYVPASLLQAVGVLTRDSGLALHQAMAMVTWRMADMLGLTDRGRLVAGGRADLVRFRFVGDTPLVRGLYCGGRAVF